jgi:hypothetical protein
MCTIVIERRIRGVELLQLARKTKSMVNLSVHQDGRHPRTRIPEVLDTEASIAEI